MQTQFYVETKNEKTKDYFELLIALGFHCQLYDSSKANEQLTILLLILYDEDSSIIDKTGSDSIEIYNVANRLYFDNVYNIIQLLINRHIFSPALDYLTVPAPEADQQLKLNKLLFEASYAGINLDDNKKAKDLLRDVFSNFAFARLPLAYNILSVYKDITVTVKDFVEYDFLQELREMFSAVQLSKLLPCRLCTNYIDRSSKTGQASWRRIKEYKQFVLGVGVGQICDRYLLLIPKRHMISFAFLSDSEKEEFIEIMNEITNFNQQQFGTGTVFLEHGAKLVSNFSKSIEHAHIHVVTSPVPLEPGFKKISFDDLFEIDGMYHLYIEKNDVFVSEVNTKASQYWRRLVAQQNGRQWDWRKTNEIDQELNQIRELYRTL